MTHGLGPLLGLVVLAVIPIYLVSPWKLSAKASGPGWVASVPIFNLIVWIQNPSGGLCS